MRGELFVDDTSGSLVPIHGTDPRHGEWRHVAFVPVPLTEVEPVLDARAYRAVADARAAVAGLDSTARHLPNPTLLRQPTLRREAQSTSALEGTYAPLADVLLADVDDPRSGDEHQRYRQELTEILNYVEAAEEAFAWQEGGRPVTVGLLADLQGVLVRGTRAESVDSGRVRTTQVVIGRDPAAPVHASRFVPSPPGDSLEAQVRDLVDWLRLSQDHEIDPVVAAAMAHYQFETLHPFHDGNGRIGRLLIVLHLRHLGVLSEPTLTVSPWFESRRAEYYQALFGVSTRGDWATWVTFFAQGLAESARSTQRRMRALVAVQEELKGVVRRSELRSAKALDLVDLAVARPSFSVRVVESSLGVAYGTANSLVGKLVAAGVLAQAGSGKSRYARRFHAPRVIEVLLQD